MSDSTITRDLRIRHRRLPHWQQGGSVYFVTFRSARGPLPSEALRMVAEALRFGDSRHFTLHFAVLMPDHVHVLLQPLESSPGVWRNLSGIMKGASARRINILTGESGSVWRPESFDRIIRDQEEYLEKWNYMLNNPVKAGLVERPEDYEFTIAGDDPRDATAREPER